jgi:hypothetical protein
VARVAAARLRADLAARGRSDVQRWPELLRVSIASGLAWVAARRAGVPLPVLAPLATLSTVQRTSYGTLREGLRQAVGVLLGALAALVVGALLGVRWWTVAGIVLGALLLSRRSTGMQAATTSLLVLALGTRYGHVRVEALLIGTAVGVAVSVVTPVSLVGRARDALAALAEDVGRLLCDIAAGVAVPFEDAQAQTWLKRARDLEEPLAHARQTVRDARESVRWTPLGRAPQVRAVDLDEAVAAFDHLTGQVRGVARALAEATAQQHEDGRPSHPWLALPAREALSTCGAALFAYAEALSASRVSERLRALTRRDRRPKHADLPPRSQPGQAELTMLTESARILSEVDPAGAHRPWR